jgi:5-methylcytosine-specific restriction endonuclease McrA
LPVAPPAGIMDYITNGGNNVTLKRSPIKPKPCALCGKLGHSKSFCYLNQKPPIRVRYKSTTKKTAIRRIGKKGKKWLVVRAAYLATLTPDENGCVECAICHKPCEFNKLTVDHIIPRSKRPDLEYEPSNFQPAHYKCNKEKGSTVDPDVEYDSYALVQNRRMRHAQLFMLNADQLQTKLDEMKSTIGDMKDYEQKEFRTDIEFIEKELETRLH